MLELLWLLLPVAYLSGWVVARRRAGKGSGQRQAGFSADYFKGLNYLLDEQPDKAIDVFINMLDVNSETVETHLALGNLFRRRGEVDRAIRVHQNLIARPTLSNQQRNDALLELAQDYMRAGVLDRAEGLLQELLDKNTHLVQAQRHLLDIYQQEKDWSRAIDTARSLGAALGKPMHKVIAQFYCELADLAWVKRNRSEAQQMLKRALSQDKDCVRASILYGDMARDEGDCKAAVKAYRRVDQQDVDYLPEVLASMRTCYETLGTPEAMIKFLRDTVSRYRGISVTLALADLILKYEGDERAARFIAEQLRRRPSVRGLERLVELNLSRSDGQAKEDLLILKTLIGQLLQDKPVYKCINCGFSGKSLHWQCPSCKQWNTVKPIHGVDGE